MLEQCCWLLWVVDGIVLHEPNKHENDTNSTSHSRHCHVREVVCVCRNKTNQKHKKSKKLVQNTLCDLLASSKADQLYKQDLSTSHAILFVAVFLATTCGLTQRQGIQSCELTRTRHVLHLAKFSHDLFHYSHASLPFESKGRLFWERRKRRAKHGFFCFFSPKEFFTQQNKTEETQISSNDQTAKKSKYFSCICHWVENICFVLAQK